MTITEFKASLANSAPPAGLSPLLEALWWDGKGDWDQSHTLAQDIETKDGSWVHAYLHRKEGDPGNAAYWYARAGRSMPGGALEAEWELIASALLEENAR
ncbi:hypothetical protein AAHN97_01820 [Chitinophaga niabensis]|uniref:hypothetical protein n=1 Tax=Chitinophaga niabensis TaxID=536979 RepID=UPI0031BA3B8C